MEFLSSRRFLNAAIAVAALLLVGLAAYLGYNVWAQNRAVVDSTPVSRATEQLIESVRKQPNSIDLRMKLAQAFTVAGRDKDAVAQYEAALKLKKDFAPAYAGLGFIAGRQGDWEKSEKFWRKVIVISQKSPSANMDKGLETAHFYLGTSLFERKMYEDAIGEFKESLRMNPTASDTHYMLAVAYREIDSMDKYREELEAALSLDPKLPEANYDVGMLLIQDGDVAGGAEYLRKSADAAAQSEKPLQALKDLGPVDERVDASRAALAKDAKLALTEARIAVAIEPRSLDGQVALGDAYAKLGKKKEAAKAYRAALGVDAGNEDARAKLKKVDDGQS